MEQQLKTIYEAQQIYTKIRENEKKAQLTPKIIKEMDAEVESLRDRVTRGKAVIDELEKERRKKEKELETDKEKIKKFESKLYEVKTNKEYQALLKEIESAKVINDTVEEEVLVLMDKIEGFKKDYDSALKELTIKESEAEAKKKKMEQELRSIDAVVTDLKKTRDTLLSIIDEDLKTTYSTLIERRDGLAVVNVKNGVCLGCFMNIPPQLFIEVTSNKQVILCPSCSRIFYFIEEE